MVHIMDVAGMLITNYFITGACNGEQHLNPTVHPPWELGSLAERHADWGFCSTFFFGTLW
jgi:hypothetical protein